MGLAMFVATVAVGDNLIPATPATVEAAVPAMENSISASESASKETDKELGATLSTTEAQVKAYFADTPILAEIAFCESRFRQFDGNGNVLRGVQNSQDVGVMQINEKYHLETAQKLGLNLYTLEGNMAYGKYLYDTQGTKPWNYSSHCWGKHREVALK